MMDSYLFRVLLIPSAVFLSVLFGASYGSGREVVEFVSSHGPTGGLVAIGTLITAHAVLLVLSFEIARLYKTYNYGSFFKVLLGRGWFLYEIVILIGLVIALAITTTVGGTVVGDHFGINVWIGTVVLFAIIVVLNFFGRKIVEESMIFSILALFIVLAVLVVQLTLSHFDVVVETFTGEPYQSGGVATGLKYAIGGGGYLPLLLYCAAGLRSRSEAVTAGVFAAVNAAIPAAVFHLAFMAKYPDVINERLPTYWLFEVISNPFMLNVYVLVMFVLVAQTGVGVMQGFIERIDNWQQTRTGEAFSAKGHAGITTAMIILSMALGTMGIVALILRAYTIMFASFVVVYVIPLVTYGVYLFYKGQAKIET